MNGLSECGRLQRYINEHVVIPISRIVNSSLLKEFLEAKDLNEQRRLFDQLPLEEMKTILRWVV